MSRGGPAGRGTPAAAPLPNLLSLPEDTLLRVFSHLNQSELLTLFGGPCDAASLAAAHPRLGRLYRRAFVTQLEVKIDWNTFLGMEESVLTHKLRLTLLSYPRAETLHVRCTFFRPSVRVERYVGAQLRAVRMANLSLGWGSFRALLRACPSLVDLELYMCSWTSKCGERKKLARALGLPAPAGAELKTWSRLERLGLRNSPEILLGILSFLTLFEMHALRKLDISVGKRLKGPVFDTCAKLSKITSLGLRRTSFSSADAARILPCLPSLEELAVSHCEAITPALWGVLPPSLSVLRAGGTRLFQDTDGNSLTGGCGVPGGALHVLDASSARNPRHDVDEFGLKTWEALSSGFGELRELNLMYSTLLSDERVEDALAAMPRLEKLNLRSCDLVGNRTAAAIARHPRLSSIDIRLTAIESLGMAALRRTFKPSGENWVRSR